MPEVQLAPNQTVIEPKPARRPRWPSRLRPWLNWRTLFAAMLLLHLLPIWIVTYIPTQDGPAHIYNAKILVDGFDPANFQIRQVYSWNYALHPNILTHVILAGLLQLFPPLVAEKILLSLLVALLPLSMLYVLRGLERGAEVFSLIGFLFAYHNLLHMGFYNFSMGVSLGLFTFGWWWRHRHEMTLGGLGLFYLLALLTWSAHFAAFTALLIVIGVTAGWSLLLRVSRTTLSFVIGRLAAMLRRNSARQVSESAVDLPARRQMFNHLRWAACFAGYMLPLLAAGWDYNFRTYSREGENFNADRVEQAMWNTLTLVSYSDWQEKLIPFSPPRDIHIVYWVTLVVAGLTVLYRLGRRQWLLERDGILITAGILAWLFFALPWSRNAGGWVNDRIFILGFLFLWTWFSGFHKPLNIAVGAVLVVLSLLHTGRITYDYIQLQPDLREMAAATHLVEPHSTFSADLNGRYRSPAFPDGTKYVGPFTHVHSYYGLGRDIALFNNYETGYSYFFTRWGETRRELADYVLVWGHPSDGEHVRRYQDRYEPIHTSENLVLLRLKRQEPDLSAWTELEDGRRVLRLRMLPPRRGETPEGVVAVQRERLFSSGSYGWVRNAPRREWVRGRAAGEFGDLVGDNRDRAFRLDLPNGRYHVTCHFAAHPQGYYQVNVIANGQRVIRGRVIEEEGDTVTMRYTIDVKDGHLTQVFFTTWRKSPDRKRLDNWGLSGIEIEQAEPDPS